MLCSDLVEALWRDGRGRRSVVNLEDISTCGACIQHDEAIPIGTSVRLCYPGGEFVGTVRHCAFREIGFFMGIEFAANCRWSAKQFRPKHMVDPQSVKSYREQDQTEVLPIAARAAVGGGTPRKPPGVVNGIESVVPKKWAQRIPFINRMASRFRE